MVVDTVGTLAYADQGRSWPQIAEELGCSVGTAYSAHLALSKNLASCGLTAD